MTTEAGERAAQWLEGKLDELERALAPLVEQNSFTENVEGGNKIGVMLDALFRLEGMSREAVPSPRYAEHRVYRSQGRGGAPISLVGHLDTVFPPGTFEGYRVDGELRRGPGVLDMKGGLVVMAFALRALEQTQGLSGLPPLTLVVVSDEEVGSPEGQGVLRRALPGAQSCLVFESGRAGDAIVTRRKGTGALLAQAHGKAAHAGNAHQEGCNAIWALARFIERAQLLTDYGRGVTVNVGKVQGGQGTNTVPDRAEARVDLRFTTRADAAQLVQALRQAADEAAAGVPGTRIVLEGGVHREPLEATLESRKVCAEYAVCARVSGLGSAESPLVGGGSDANTASSMGIPSIDGLGPRGKGFHTQDEQIEALSLVPKAQALARFLAGCARGERIGEAGLPG